MEVSYFLKKRVDARKVWEEIQAKFDNKEIIEAPVVDAVKGGLVVDAGVRAFRASFNGIRPLC